MISPRRSTLFGAALSAAVLISGGARATDFVTNGSLEDGAFAETCCNYMQLAAGATNITGWTVSAGTVAHIAWGVGATDVIPAPDGIAYVDLSGFGSESPNGAIEQLLATTPGATYSFSFDRFGDGLPLVTLGSLTIAYLPTGTEGGWTTETATFVAPLGAQLLKITNVTPGSPIVFIDDIQVLGSVKSGGVPEPASWALMILGLGGVGAALRRRRLSALAA